MKKTMKFACSRSFLGVVFGFAGLFGVGASPAVAASSRVQAQLLAKGGQALSRIQEEIRSARESIEIA